MNHLETYLDRIIDQRARSGPAVDPTSALPLITPVEATPVTVESDDGDSDAQPLGLLGALKRRWYIVFLVFVLLAPAAVYAVWHFVQPGHIVVARLEIAPAVLDIMTGNEDRPIGNYQDFVATEALTITSISVLNEATRDLVEKNLRFFAEGPRSVKKKLDKILGIETQETAPEDVLQTAVNSGVIKASPRRGTHFVEVSMKSMDPDEAIQIVDTLVDKYRYTYAYDADTEGSANLKALEDEKENVYQRIDRAKKAIRDQAEESGVTDLETGTERTVSAERIHTILERTIELEAKRIALETQIKIIKAQDSNSLPAENDTAARKAYINSDVYVRELTRQLVMMEQQLLVAKEKLFELNPVIREKEALLKAFQARLEFRRSESGREYDLLIAGQTGKIRKGKLAAIQTELIQTIEEEDRFRALLQTEKEDATMRAHAYLEIKDKQFSVKLDMEIYDAISRRIKQLEMEKNQKPRISIVEPANRKRYEDKRIPYSAGVTMGIFGLGCLLALLIDKADKRVKEAEEVATLMSLPLIGTVANARTVKAAKFAAQIASDYQTIRTNLTLLGTGGMPKHLCVTSPGPREGKSSFSVNLATSLSKSGERVLLIDGDLRKPDTLRKMNSVHITEQVSHVPIEGGSTYSIWNVGSTGLDILVPDVGNRGDVYELIASPMMAHRIMSVSQKYDHVIIDTPPLLAFPDALIWARLSGVAIMIGFAGKTTIDDLIEAKDRLGQTNAHLLGTVLNNVKVTHGYQRYHYGYYDHKGGRRDVRMNKKLMMAAREAQKTKTPKKVKEKTA